MTLSRRDFLKTTGAATALALPAFLALRLEISHPPTDIYAMDITKATARTTERAPAETFTGDVFVDMLFTPEEPARTAGATVTFTPGARTAWHTHPLGQTLIITAGVGLVQTEGSPVETVRAGDVVWFPPGEKHWHGAAPEQSMTHIAIQEAQDGAMVEWMEHVTDDEYEAA